MKGICTERTQFLAGSVDVKLGSDPICISPYYRVLRIDCTVEPRYFKYVARTKPFLTLLKNAAVERADAVRKNFDRETFFASEIKLPEPDEQRAIVSVLDDGERELSLLRAEYSALGTTEGQSGDSTPYWTLARRPGRRASQGKGRDRCLYPYRTTKSTFHSYRPWILFQKMRHPWNVLLTREEANRERGGKADQRFPRRHPERKPGTHSTESSYEAAAFPSLKTGLPRQLSA